MIEKRGISVLGRETTTLSQDEYQWKGVDFSNGIFLDAGCGRGGWTNAIVEHIKATGGNSQVIAVDHAQSCEAHIMKLAEHAPFLRFLCADLANMTSIADENIDVITCGDSLCNINARPLYLMKVLGEFLRVLNSRGRLIIGEQVWMPEPIKPQHMAWGRRWQIVKAIQHLLGEPHLEEFVPEDLAYALELSGFSEIRWAIFEDEKPWEDIEWGLSGSSLGPVARAQGLESEELRAAFLKEVEGVRNIFREHGATWLPYNVMHAVKP